MSQQPYQQRDRKEEFDKVVQAAYGHWDDIYAALAPQLDHARGNNAGKHVACPVHSPSENGFRLLKTFNDDGTGGCWTCHGRHLKRGFQLLAWVNNISFAQAVKEVAEYLGIDHKRSGHSASSARAVNARRVQKPTPQKSKAELAKERRNRASYLNRLWSEAYPSDHPQAKPLRTYLQSRGIETDHLPASLRLHPGLDYVTKDDDGSRLTLGPFPTILSQVCKVVDGKAKPISLHRTYLNSEGTAKAFKTEDARFKSKKILKAVDGDGGNTGGFIPLEKPTRILCVTEGLENALSVKQATNLPTWSCLSTSFLEAVAIPLTLQHVQASMPIEHILIWADKDHDKEINGETVNPGRDAAERLQARLVKEGFQVHILYPPLPLEEGSHKGVDWNDVLLRLGQSGFPDAFAIQRIVQAQHVA
jgi:phage/plasmid primase-like uncharacterized protein